MRSLRLSLVRRFYAVCLGERLIKLLLAIGFLPIAGTAAELLPIDQPDSKRRITYATVGEDATSTTYYFFYSIPGAGAVSKVRLLWNGGAQNRPTITDYYIDGSSILVVERSAERESLPKLVRGRDAPFQPIREYRFSVGREDAPLEGAEAGKLTREERLTLANLIHALSLQRKPLPSRAQ